MATPTEPATKPSPPATPRKVAAPTEFIILLGAREAETGPFSWVPQTNPVGGALLTYSVPPRTKKAAEVAIEMHVGVGADAKPGRWKAIPKAQWKGGVYIKEPEMVPVAVREILAD